MPLILFSILEERGVFDTRSTADVVILDQFKPADINGDNLVNLEDFRLWLENFKKYRSDKARYSHKADLDKDGAIALSDFSLWLDKWRGFKRYKKNPKEFTAENNSGLIASWSLDEETGSGAFIQEDISGRYNLTPIGTEYFPHGLVEGSRIMTNGDSIEISNGEELDFSQDKYIFSVWINKFDQSMDNLGENPNVFIWDSTTNKFYMTSQSDLGLDLYDLISVYKNYGFETLIETGLDGWFNLIVAYEPESNTVKYYVNGTYIGVFLSTPVRDEENSIILSLFPRDGAIAFDNIQIWRGDNSIDTVYAESIDSIQKMADRRVVDDSIAEDEKQVVKKEREVDPLLLRSRMKNCGACSSEYKYIGISWKDEDGSCDELTDQARFEVDAADDEDGPPLYHCSRCGVDGQDCDKAPCPIRSDSTFASHYYSWLEYGEYYKDEMDAYDYYVFNCIDERPSCPALKACGNTNFHACSSEFIYANERWDSVDESGNKVNARFFCNCSCTSGSADIQGMNSTGKWHNIDVGFMKKTYEDCVNTCTNPNLATQNVRR